MVMMPGNGAADPVDRLLDQAVEASERRIEELQERLIEAEVRCRVTEELRQRAETPTRSTMTAAEKSAYIRAHGKAEYDKLPWK
jgi:hypothetical protein